MSAETLLTIGSGGAAGAVAALVGADGTATHAHRLRLLRPAAPMRDVADALHILCMLHGRHPGVIDHALAHGQPEPVTPWLALAADGFARERERLAMLVAAVGPLPSTPGQAESESAVAAQRHALDTLVQSDRLGCAIGAAAALLLDWRAVRELLDAAAERLGLEPAPDRLPDDGATAMALGAIVNRPPVERAAMFGAQQLLAQHRGLWDLLEARAAARDAG